MDKSETTDIALFVRGSKDDIDTWNRSRIVDTLLREARVPPDLASRIAEEVENQVKSLNLRSLTATLVRELVDAKLLEYGQQRALSRHTRIGLPVKDIEFLLTYQNKENANVPHGCEAVNLNIAEKVIKEYGLMHVFTEDVSLAHVRGDVHIHDLGFLLRPYCGGNNLVYIAKFGLNLAGTSNTAKPAKHPEVLLAHMMKFAAALQGCFAGAIGFDAVNTFFAPYLVGMSYKDIKQLAQMLVFEFNQQAVARGGQSCHHDSSLLVYDKHTERFVVKSIGNFVNSYIDLPGSSKIEERYDVLSFSAITGEIQLKPIYAVTKHKRLNNLYRIKTFMGQEITVTEDHSLFSYNDKGDVIQVKPSDNPKTILIPARINVPIKYTVGDCINLSVYTVKPSNNKIVISNELIRLFGYYVADGYTNDINNNQGCVNISVFEQDKAEDIIMCIDKVFGIKRSWNNNKVSLSGTIFNEFFRYHCGRVSYQKRVPEVIMFGSEDIIKEFLSAYLSCDGWICKNRIGMTTVSHELFSDLMFLLNRLGALPCCRKRISKVKKIKDYQVKNTRLQYEITIGSGFFDTVYFKSKRKDTKRIEYIKRFGRKSQRRYNYSIMKQYLKDEGYKSTNYDYKSNQRKLKLDTLEEMNDSSLLFTRLLNLLPVEIKTIEKVIGEDYVYDISVRDNENFMLSDGTFAHNSIFSDINLYYEIPKHFAHVQAIGPGGVTTGKTYGQYDKEAKLFVKALMEVYLEGDGCGRPFFWPKPDFHITDQFFREPGHESMLELLCAVASEKGNTYFVFDRGNTAKISECCRLKLAYTEQDLLDARTPWKMRFCALQNVTINLPRIAYEAKGSDAELFHILKQRTKIMTKAHLQKRAFIQKLLDLEDKGPLGLLSMSLDGERYLRMHRTTHLMGMLGLNEMVKAHTGKEMDETKEALTFGYEVISTFHTYASVLAKEHKINLVLEQTPAESACYRMAKLDLQHFPQEATPIVRGRLDSQEVYYTNSTYLGMQADVNFIERIRMEGIFHPIIEGGALTHVWLGEHKPPAKTLANVVRKVFVETLNDQIAFSPEFTTCNVCNRTSRGLRDSCPHCHSTNVDGITRITGYFSKISSWNSGKISELHDRVKTHI